MNQGLNPLDFEKQQLSLGFEGFPQISVSFSKVVCLILLAALQATPTIIIALILITLKVQKQSSRYIQFFVCDFQI